MNRRELLHAAGAAACVATLPKILDAVCTNAPTKKVGPVPASGGCTTSCVQLGMRGVYPNCYYPQYLNYNKTLGNNALAVINGARVAIGNRTITQTQWNQVISYRTQVASMISLAQTQFNDCARMQYFGPGIYNYATAGQISQAQQWAEQNNFDANIAVELTYNGSPMADNTNNPDLHQLIMQLPEEQGSFDSIWSLCNAQINSVTVPQTGFCQSLTTNPQAMMDSANNAMAIGTLLLSASMIPTPASASLAVAGAVEAGGGAVFYLLAEMCTQ